MSFYFVFKNYEIPLHGDILDNFIDIVLNEKLFDEKSFFEIKHEIEEPYIY